MNIESVKNLTAAVAAIELGGLDNVIEQMREVRLTGLETKDLVVDAGIQRFCPDWEAKKDKKRAWYVLFTFRLDSGQEVITGSFGWFKGSDSYQFNVDIHNSLKLTRVEKDRLKREHTENRKLAELERQKEQEATASRATEIWKNLPLHGRSKYLQRKKVAAFNGRFTRGSFVLPVYGFDKKLTGLQFIDPEGNKRFLTGTVKKGRFCILGEHIKPDGVMAIAEGYATGASIRMATGWIVFIAFDAGNLKFVAVAVRERYPLAKIVLYADDDIANPDNPGRSKAVEAARSVGGVVIYPTWSTAA